MTIKSFKGKLEDGAIETIRLHTNNGSTGYKIVKLQLMPEAPGTADSEHIVKIYSIPQTTASSTIDLDDNTLIAAALTGNSTNITQNISQSIIIDNIKTICKQSNSNFQSHLFDEKINETFNTYKRNS